MAWLYPGAAPGEGVEVRVRGGGCALTRGPRVLLTVFLAVLGPHLAADKCPVPPGEGSGRPQLLPQALDAGPGPGGARPARPLPRPGGGAVSRRAWGRQQQRQQQEEAEPGRARAARHGHPALRRPRGFRSGIQGPAGIGVAATTTDPRVGRV
jgi:hypothetical protein